MSAQEIYEQDWETAELTLMYQDGGEVQARSISLSREQLQEQQEDDTEITSEEFQQRIMQNAVRMLQQPVSVTEEDDNVIRLLPPTAIVGVEIRVNGGTRNIVVPSA